MLLPVGEIVFDELLGLSYTSAYLDAKLSNLLQYLCWDISE